MRRAAALAACVLLAACGREADAPAPSEEPAASHAAPAAAPASGQRPAPPADIALDGEGLRFVNAATGSTRLLPFGAPEGQVLTALEPIRGAPTARSSNDECGAGPLAFADWGDDFQLVFQEGRFVGWSVDDPGLTTMSGVGVGSSRDDLEAAYKAEVGQSTLGTEFSAGDLHGLLSTRGPTARVTTLWAGTICVFR